MARPAHVYVFDLESMALINATLVKERSGRQHARVGGIPHIVCHSAGVDSGIQQYLGRRDPAVSRCAQRGGGM